MGGAAAVALAAVAVLLAAEAARAADGTGIPAGATICTDRGSAEAGVWAYGNGTYRAALTWTIRASAAPDGGGEIELLRRTAWELTTVRVVAPQPGTHFYRVCMTNDSTAPVHYRVHFGPLGPANFARSGSHTAVLDPGGRACGDWLSGILAPRGRFVGGSDAPVTFSVRVTDGDANELRNDIVQAQATAVDAVLTLPATENFEACVSNTSSRVATVAWDLQAA
jgi:hypothetical protein